MWPSWSHWDQQSLSNTSITSGSHSYPRWDWPMYGAVKWRGCWIMRERSLKMVGGSKNLEGGSMVVFSVSFCVNGCARSCNAFRNPLLCGYFMYMCVLWAESIQCLITFLTKALNQSPSCGETPALSGSGWIQTSTNRIWPTLWMVMRYTCYRHF